MFDTIIRGGTVIDGLQTPRFRGDIGIKDGRVASIGRIHNGDGARVIDAEGLIVAPGSWTCTLTTTRRCIGTRGAASRAGTG